jgi:putative ABC transport system substrate-binding protein
MIIWWSSVGGIVTLLFSLLGTPLTADAQQAPPIPRLGFLASASADVTTSLLAALQQGLRALGYVEGQNILIESRYAAGDFARLPALAGELVRLPVDVIVTEGAPAAHAAQQRTTTIPIVIGNAGDPVGMGLVASLARPGGNLTGLSMMSPELMGKRLELLKEMVPSASRVAVLFNPANPTSPLQGQECQATAPALGVTLLPFEATAADEIDRAFTAMHQERVEALIVVGDAMFGTHQRRVIELAAQARLPAMYNLRGFVDAGGLMSYGTHFEDLYRRAATYVDKILKGTKPADLPVEQPTKFALIINLKTARALGITMPPTLLFQADEVIK